jgi:hypothetical protein
MPRRKKAGLPASRSILPLTKEKLACIPRKRAVTDHHGPKGISWAAGTGQDRTGQDRTGTMLFSLDDAVELQQPVGMKEIKSE